MTSTINPDPGSSLVRADRRGRVLIGAAQREALLDEFDRSAMSAAAFCRLHGLTYPTFANWLQKRRAGKSAALHHHAPAFAEVVFERDSLAVTSVPPLRLSLRSGVSFEITCTEQMPLAVELLRALEPPRSC